MNATPDHQGVVSGPKHAGASEPTTSGLETRYTRTLMEPVTSAFASGPRQRDSDFRSMACCLLSHRA